MASHVIAPAPKASRGMRRVFAGAGLLAAAIVALHFYTQVVANYSHFDARHYGQFWARRWWLVAHLGGGSLALLLGPLQFIAPLRRRYLKAHRWVGRAYLGGVLVALVGAVYMSLRVSQSKDFGRALLFLALAWAVTSTLGWVAAMRRQFAAHREWMIRSYVVTFAFALFRLMEQVNVFGWMSEDAQSVMLTWMSWTLPLLACEVVLQWRRTIGPARRAA